MTSDNDQTAGAQAPGEPQAVEEQNGGHEPANQSPGYNDPVPGRGEGREGGETNDPHPAWRPGDDPAGQPEPGSGQTETEPGRERASGDGIEEIPHTEREGTGNM